jgi:hypothetical protein
MVQLCRAVWNWAGRYSSATGVAKDSNFFSGMATSKSRRRAVDRPAATNMISTAICNTASQAQARRIGKLRRDHIAQITEQDDNLSKWGTQFVVEWGGLFAC